MPQGDGGAYVVEGLDATLGDRDAVTDRPKAVTLPGHGPRQRPLRTDEKGRWK
jgi:hypothetical protein